jgi:hypothetical protein
VVVGRKLVVHAHMADHVLDHAVHVVEPLGGEHVAVEFRVQIGRVVGRALPG